MDCLFSLLGAKLNNLDFNDITVLNGISNNLRTLTYGRESVSLVDGRGYLDSFCLLNDLKISYEICSMSDLRKDNNEEEFFVVFMPKSILENRKLNNSIRYFFPFYSAFGIKEMNGEKAVLEVFGPGRKSERYFELTLDELRSYENIAATPLNKAVYIVKMNRLSGLVEEKEMMAHLYKRYSLFSQNRSRVYEKTNCFSGPQFYEMFIDNLKEFVDRAFVKFDRKEYLRQYIFSTSINSGGVAFYRFDFANALEKSRILRDFSLEEYITKLRHCSNGWSEVCRLLRTYQREEKGFDKILYEEIKDIVEIVSEKELSAMEDIIRCLKNHITDWEEIYDLSN